MITEEQIESVLDRMEDSEVTIPEIVKGLASEHPVVHAYITSPQFDEILSQTEREYFHFLVVSLYMIIKEYYPDCMLIPIEEEEIGAKEEELWGIWEKLGNKEFNSKLDLFFEETEEEDLLALIEDALMETEDDLITANGREPVFIALKTLMDLFISRKK
jgi:hypothetical protein